MSDIIKLANRFAAWTAGYDNGIEDINQNSWGDPYSSWSAWRRYLERKNEWDESLDNSYPDYKRGYEKAFIKNNGIGMSTAPEEQELESWEDFEIPFGENPEKDTTVRLEKIDLFYKKYLALGRDVEVWHCGRDLDGGHFSLNYLRTGEGINYLGPGIYFTDNERLARRYAKYVDKAYIYKCIIPTDGLYDSNRGEPLHLREKMINLEDAMVEEFELKDRGRVAPTSSFRYGKHGVGFLFEKYGMQVALKLLKNIGINGAYEIIGGGAVEYCVFDPSIITVIGKEPVEKSE